METLLRIRRSALVYATLGLVACGSPETRTDGPIPDTNVTETTGDPNNPFGNPNIPVNGEPPKAPPVDEEEFEAERQARRELFRGITSWAIQLQNIDAQAVKESRYDLVTLDYSRDGSDPGAYTKSEILNMKGDGESKKLVLAYLSVSEAEDFRYYFDVAAPYVDVPVPDWPGHYKVRYWTPEWRAVLESYLARIIAAGFDGVYLNLVDSYEYYGPGGASGLNRESAAAEMQDLVVHLAEFAREHDEEFLVVTLNSPGLLHTYQATDPYFAQVDGIAVANNFLAQNADSQLDLEDLDAVLDSFLIQDRPVLALGYITRPEDVALFYERARQRQFVPFCTALAMDTLTVNTGFEPQ